LNDQLSWTFTDRRGVVYHEKPIMVRVIKKTMAVPICISTFQRMDRAIRGIDTPNTWPQILDCPRRDCVVPENKSDGLEHTIRNRWVTGFFKLGRTPESRFTKQYRLGSHSLIDGGFSPARVVGSAALTFINRASHQIRSLRPAVDSLVRQPFEQTLIL
jgi:hypothetical protein